MHTRNEGSDLPVNELKKKWDFFYESLHDAIWYPDPFDWDNGELMISMFLMRDFILQKISLGSTKEEVIRDSEFISNFKDSVYWLHVANKCKTKYN
jgi:hypothetical protein